MRYIVPALTVIVVLGAIVPVVGVAQDEAYSGTHVSFGTDANAVTDYSVSGATVLSSVQVQSADDAEGSGLVDVGASLSTVTSLDGAGLSLAAETSTSATIETDGSASMDAHDNEHGVLVVRAGGESQYVQANLSDDAEASTTGDGRVAVTTADGVEGSFIVAGDGEVTVNEEGDVAANLGEDGQLVFRAYADSKSDDDDADEQLIADGEATGEVHVMSQGGETVTDTIVYGEDTAIEAQQTAENEIEVTVDRAASEGKVVITSVSESAMDAANGVSVAVDGEAAAQASSESELRSAIDSDQSKYLVRQSSDAEGSADVLVAVNHFSERTITMSEGDGSTPTDDSGDGNDGLATPGQPGFGVLVATMALLAAAIVAIRRG